jgi:DNA-binding transcriptional regulator PaaX
MKTPMKKAVHASLKIIGLAGFAGTVVVAPNATAAVGKLLVTVTKPLDIPERERIYRNLKRQGLVQIDKVEKASYRLTITPAGAHRLTSESLSDIEIPKMKKWDGKWRLVCYDIPAGKNIERRTLAKHLHRMGFTALQKSMWVHPHECIEQIEQITDSLTIGRYVSVMEVVKLDRYSTHRLISTYQDVVSV